MYNKGGITSSEINKIRIYQSFHFNDNIENNELMI